MISQTKSGYCVKCCGWAEAVYRIQKSTIVKEVVIQESIELSRVFCDKIGVYDEG